MKLAYISGQITGLANLNKPKFTAAEMLLRKHGYNVINPHTICNDLPKTAPWETFMRRCIEHLPKADVLFQLDDWEKSQGAILESVIAQNLSIRVYELEKHSFTDATK